MKKKRKTKSKKEIQPRNKMYNEREIGKVTMVTENKKEMSRREK